MKKTIVKTSLCIILAALVLFLLLPFLETKQDVSTDQRAKPQIFTSNPLTAIARRLASLFGFNKQKEQRPVLSEKEINEQFGTPLYASVPNGAFPQDSNGNPAQPSVSVDGKPILASYEGEEDWILIPQTAPELNAQGMHEINIKDNPYDRYVREEQNKKHSPLASNTAQRAEENQPVSRWKQWMAPVKKFFGLSDAEAVDAAHLTGAQTNGDAFQLASAANAQNRGNYNPASVQSPTLNPPNINRTLDSSFANWQEQDTLKASEQLYSLIYPKDSLQSAANMLAEAKFPDPKQASQREAFAKREYERMKQELNTFIRSGMAELQQNTQEKDIITDILGGCQIASLPQTNKMCLDEGEENQGSNKKEIAQEQAKNQQVFYEITRLHLPHAPITPVLGKVKTRPEVPQEPAQQELQEGTETEPQEENASLQEEQRKARKSIEIAAWLYDKNKCDQNDCFLVANEIQVSPDISDSVKKAGGQFVGDPLHTYKPLQKEYLAYVKEQVKDLSEEEQQKALQQAAKDFLEAAPAYVPYTSEELQEPYNNLMATLETKKADPNASFYYVTNPHDVLETAEAIDGYALLFSRQEMKENSTDEGTVITIDTAQNVRAVTDEASRMFKDVSDEVMRAKLNQGIDQFNKLLKINKGNAAAAYNTIVEQHKQDHLKK